MLSETYPNRLVLYSGTSGANTSNNINNGTLNYPYVLDLLSAHGVTFKNYAGPPGPGPARGWRSPVRPSISAAACPLVRDAPYVAR